MEWWGLEQAELELQHCTRCGEYFTTSKALAQGRERAGEPLPMSDLCPSCRALTARQTLAAAFGEGR